MKQSIKITLITLGALVILAVVGLFTLGLLSAVLIGSRDVVGEETAIEALYQIAEAERKHFAAHGEYATLDQLIQQNFLEKNFADKGIKSRYDLTVKVMPKTAGEESWYKANADAKGKDNYIFIPTWRHFYIGSDVKEICVNEKQPASASDPPLKR